MLRVVFVANHNTKHRALSQIITSLILIAIVTTVGTVVLFRGLDVINTFSVNIGILDKNRLEGVQEDLVIENVRFRNVNEPLIENRVEILITNFGNVPTSISSITITESSSQKLIYDDRNIYGEDLQILSSKNFTLMTQRNFDSTYADEQYVISILTSRGNLFTKFTTPFNSET